jgi:hypothetical protein
MKKVEKEQTIEALKKAGIKHFIFKRDGSIRVMSSYFYRGQGGTEEGLKAKVLSAFPKAEIIETGDHFTSFIGGAPVHKQSHIYVIFKK